MDTIPLQSYPALVEASFVCDIPEAEVLLHGVIDRIDHADSGSGLWLREFKSGLQWRESVSLAGYRGPCLSRACLRLSVSGVRCLQGLKSLKRLQTLLYSYVVFRLTGTLPKKVSAIYLTTSSRSVIAFVTTFVVVGTEPQVCIEAIESGETREYTPTAGDMTKVVATVTTIASRIRAGDFTATPAKVSCGMCPFQKSCVHSVASRR